MYVIHSIMPWVGGNHYEPFMHCYLVLQRIFTYRYIHSIIMIIVYSKLTVSDLS